VLHIISNHYRSQCPDNEKSIGHFPLSFKVIEQHFQSLCSIGHHFCLLQERYCKTQQMIFLLALNAKINEKKQTQKNTQKKIWFTNKLSLNLYKKVLQFINRFLFSLQESFPYKRMTRKLIVDRSKFPISNIIGCLTSLAQRQSEQTSNCFIKVYIFMSAVLA